MVINIGHRFETLGGALETKVIRNEEAVSQSGSLVGWGGEGGGGIH